MDKSGKRGGNGRVLRPLLWWFILVLILFAIHTHQRLMEQTRLHFKVTLKGQPIDAVVRFDGKPAINGHKISLGNHTFSVTYFKAESFQTNFFAWYGEHDFGDIALKRLMGTLTLQADPSAPLITVTGPDFSTTLTHCASTNLTVPTDQYHVWAQYPYWSHSENVLISANMSSTCRFAPPMGTLELTCNHDGATYQIQSYSWPYSDSGDLPKTFARLPAGDYQLTITHHGHQIQKSVTVMAWTTNEWTAQFIYGAVRLETEPPGAVVTDGDGRKWGTTPVTLLELRPGTWNFTLALEDYEPVVARLNVTADATNYFQTNLVNRYYAAALQSARSYFASGQYDEAAQSANVALKYKTGDAEATSLQREAMGMSHLARGRSDGQRGDFDAAIGELNIALQSIPDNVEARQLLADYTKRQAELAEQERKRREAALAERKAREKIAELQQSFNELLSGVENAGQFQEHELTTTNNVSAVGVAIKEALSGGNPSFRIVRFEQPRPDIFTLQARQIVGLGYRDCFIVGEAVREAETRILFKVLEYDHPPELKLLGGALTINTQTGNNPAAEANFQQQIREGEPLVEGRIRVAISQAVSNGGAQ